MPRTICENIFTQAAFAPLVWDSAWKVIELYENESLKSKAVKEMHGRDV